MAARIEGLGHHQGASQAWRNPAVEPRSQELYKLAQRRRSLFALDPPSPLPPPVPGHGYQHVRGASATSAASSSSLGLGWAEEEGEGWERGSDTGSDALPGMPCCTTPRVSDGGGGRGGVTRHSALSLLSRPSSLSSSRASSVTTEAGGSIPAAVSSTSAPAHGRGGGCSSSRAQGQGGAPRPGPACHGGHQGHSPGFIPPHLLAEESRRVGQGDAAGSGVQAGPGALASPTSAPGPGLLPLPPFPGPGSPPLTRHRAASGHM